MGYTLIIVVVFALIVVGYGTYKQYNKACLLKKNLNEDNAETPELTPSASVAGSSVGSKTTGVKQQVK